MDLLAGILRLQTKTRKKEGLVADEMLNLQVEKFF